MSDELITRSIEGLIASLEDAWARADADAFARRFSNDGTFTNVLGMFFRGRENGTTPYSRRCSREARWPCES